MSREVTIGVHPIPSFGEHFAVDLEESTKRMVAGRACFGSEFECACQECFVVVHGR